jgi:hypothetical protein
MTTLETLAKQGNVNVISIGYNMKCKNVITKSILYFDGERFCLKNGGINMYCDDTSDLLLDTKENRKLLKLQCN